MIHILNRRELLTTFSMEEQSRVRDSLSQNNIEYRVKVVNPSARSTFGASGRSRTGSFAVNMDSAYQYYIYVRACDMERARACLRNI